MWVLPVGEVWERGGLRPGCIRNAACLPLSFCPLCPMGGAPSQPPEAVRSSASWRICLSLETSFAVSELDYTGRSPSHSQSGS